ncbi:MAG: hypothetical protein V3T88_02795 [Nitrosomonadaceae bacterium]
MSDADGRFPAFFLDGIYDEEQQDNSGTATGFDGVTLWTRPDIGGAGEGQFELWLNDNTYNIPNIVLGSDDEYYQSLADASQGNDPTTSADKWKQLQLGQVWNANVTYASDDSVYGSDGYLYLSKVSSNLNNNPTSNTANWRPATKLRFVKGADIASASALATGSDGDYFDVTGTTTITTIDTVGVDTVIKLHFDGILTLTHSATDLILPGGANITTAAGDEFEFVEYASGDWRCTAYALASGQAVIETTSFATAAEVQTGTEAAKAISPAEAQEHLSAAKAWGNFNGTGQVATRSSYNMGSLTDVGTGHYTANLSITMADTDYLYDIKAYRATGDFPLGINIITVTTTAITFETMNPSAVRTDAPHIIIEIYGDV